jgi:hypothetical protein
MTRSGIRSHDLFGAPVLDVPVREQMYAGNGKQAIYTPDDVAKMIVAHYKPAGRLCEPCKGDGAFVRAMPGCDWYEKAEGRDYMSATGHWDWVITNPPWNDVMSFLRKSLQVADNVVFLCYASAWWTRARQAEITTGGFGMAEMLVVPTPPPPWPQSGFLLTATHLRRGWTGNIKLTHAPNSGICERDDT